MGVAEVREFCGVGGAGRGLLRAAMTQLGLIARSYHFILSLPKDGYSSSRGPFDRLPSTQIKASLEGAPDSQTHHL